MPVLVYGAEDVEMNWLQPPLPGGTPSSEGIADNIYQLVQCDQVSATARETLGARKKGPRLGILSKKAAQDGDLN